jgi:ribosomal protein L7/L12
MTGPSHPLPASVQAALARGDKLLAIQLLRASAGLDLKSAKDAVERGGLDTLIPPDVAEPALVSWPPQVQAALQRGQKVAAIRVLREATGLGLKEAKAAVEAQLGERGTRDHSLGPGELPRARWGGWRMLLVGLLAGLLALLAYLGRGR